MEPNAELASIVNILWAPGYSGVLNNGKADRLVNLDFDCPADKYRKAIKQLEEKGNDREAVVDLWVFGKTDIGSNWRNTSRALVSVL